jgi:multiple sugar transport system substrate-binding protein/putative aldouronate transport system substrate-binding protein
MKKRFIYLFLCLTIIASLFSGCFKDEEEATDENALLTVDVFADQANYQGMQSGWFGKIVKDKFNMELNIIAPNVAGGGDTLFQTRSAAGDLGDLILIGTDEGKLKDSVESQLLLDMTDLLEEKDVYKNYKDAISAVTELAGTDGIWGLPETISSQSPDTPMEGNELTFGPYLRWDIYKEIGYPEVETLEDLLPVLKDMQDANPKTEDGKDVYALSLFKDWDDNMMNNAKQPTCLYGYDELGFVLAKADGSDFQSIIESDSEYVRVLKFFYEANQMGLVDPDSTTQNFDTLGTKYTDGQVLYSPWPWLGQTQYNTVENKEAGKGFMLVPIEDMQIFSYGCIPQGNTKYVIGIGSQAEQPERLAEFIDWIYSPEGQEINAQGNGSCGPEGLTWELQDGKAVLTEFGKEALYNPDADVPEEWGGGTFSDGVSALNFQALNNTDIDPNTNEAYDFNLWESVLADNTTALQEDWSEHMDGATTTKEYLENNDMIAVANGTGYVAPAEDSDISTIRNQCKDLIVNYSWQMIFAKNSSEFNSLLKEMQEQVEGLGYEEVLKVDMANAKEQDELRKAAVK